MNKNILSAAFAFFITIMISSCGNSVTNVWDYYIKNHVEQHKTGEVTTSKSKMILRTSESVNKSQLEFIAYKQDSARYLVIGSHKVAKNFYINDSLYSFDVTSLYSKVRGDDFIRQMGDLSIYFTHIPLNNIDAFLAQWPALKATYRTTAVPQGQTVYIDYALTSNVFLSFPKTGKAEAPASCVIWVGRRKHVISTNDLVKVMGEMKGFN